MRMFITVNALRKALKDSLHNISQTRDKLDNTPLDGHHRMNPFGTPRDSTDTE